MYRRDMLERIQPADPYGDGRPAVWPRIPEGPVDYIMVGEAPGKTEVKKGEPFVGRAGTLARGVVEEVGLGVVHYTNSSLFRPATGKKDKPPTAAIFKQERPRLYTEIAMLRPKAVIAVGATAAEALLGNQPRMRGMVKELTIYGDKHLVYCTWHPSAIFYKPDFYRDLVTDLYRAKALEVPERFTPETLVLAESKECFVGRQITVDAEGTSTIPFLADFLLVTVRDEISTTLFFSGDLVRLADLLARYNGGVLGHNAPYDEILLRRHGVPIRFTKDTILRHYSQDERKGSHKLKSLSPVIAGIDTGIDLIWPYIHGKTSEEENDEERVAWKDIPTDVLSAYCAGDSRSTARLDNALARSEDERTARLYQFLCRGLRAFTAGYSQGIRVDRSALKEVTEQQEQAVAVLLKEFDFNPESNPQTLQAFRAAGYDVDSVGKDIIAKLEGELPRKYEAFKHENKLLKGFLRPLHGYEEKGVWVPGWVEKDGRTHPYIGLYRTDSGRTSASDPNIQQVPPSLRHLFISDDGWVFVGWDYRVHEVRGIAYYSQDPILLDLLRERTADPHAYISAQVGIERQQGKRSVFSVAYGAGISKLVETGIPLEKAKQVYAAIQAMFPGLDKWRETVYNSMYDQGYVETPYGRRRHFDYLDKKTIHKAKRVAVNFAVQSLCGDIALDSAIQVYEKLDYAPLIFVHDFNAIQVREEDADKVMAAAEEIGSNILTNPWVEFVPEMYSGHSWGAMKHSEPIEITE